MASARWRIERVRDGQWFFRQILWIDSIASRLGAWLIREFGTIMLRDVSPRSNPDTIFGGNILHKPPQALRAAGFPSNPGVQRDSHHFASLAIETVKCVLEILLVGRSARTTKPRGHMEFAIVTFDKYQLYKCLSVPSSTNTHNHSCMEPSTSLPFLHPEGPSPTADQSNKGCPRCTPRLYTTSCGPFLST